MRRHRGQVVGVVVHVVAIAGLRRSPVAAPIVGNDAIAVQEEEQHLRIPVVSRQWPAMTEDDGLSVSPVLVEDLRTVVSGDHTHLELSFLE